MTADADIRRLRAHLGELAADVDDALVRPHVLTIPSAERLSLYRRARMLVGRVLRAMGLMRARRLEPWLHTLKHAPDVDGAKIWLIWAIGDERDDLRQACARFSRLQAELPGYLPVLVTDVADFAFFSRLGWLVEYVPKRICGSGAYGERKQRYLAWRYRDAPAVPASSGLTSDVTVEALHIV